MTAGASPAPVTATAASYSRVLGANDRMYLGVIGAGDRGQHDMSQFQLSKDVEAGVRSMLGLGARPKASNTMRERIELALLD